MTALLAAPTLPFTAEIAAVPPAVRTRMENVSWHGGDPRCPRFEELAYVQLSYVTFDGGIGDGELVVAASIAPRAVEVFRRLYELGFPIRGMRLVDDFGASDERSMAADNTSAFNFRVVAGTQILSQHALGRAIDINPVENPWRKPDRIAPDEGRAYVDRTDIRPGMIVRPGPIIAIFDELGWEWGGDWLHAKDDHHIVLRGGSSAGTSVRSTGARS